MGSGGTVAGARGLFCVVFFTGARGKERGCA